MILYDTISVFSIALLSIFKSPCLSCTHLCIYFIFKNKDKPICLMHHKKCVFLSEAACSLSDCPD